MMRKSESASSARTDRLCTWEEFRRATGTCPVIMEELDKINGGIYELQTELGAPSEASKEDLDFLSHLGRKINNQQPN
jgi:hypothetical protein